MRSDVISKKPRHLINSIYTVNPRAHVYNWKIYIFPSHDIGAGIPDDNTGADYDIRDYHVDSLDGPNSGVVGSKKKLKRGLNKNMAVEQNILEPAIGFL